jgi:hypothetical protein
MHNSVESNAIDFHESCEGFVKRSEKQLRPDHRFSERPFDHLGISMGSHRDSRNVERKIEMIKAAVFIRLFTM